MSVTINPIVAGTTADSLAAVSEAVLKSIRGGRAGAIGDSVTAYGSASWFNNLCIRSGGKIRRAINAGVGGQTTTQMVARIATDLPKSAKLDVIFVTGGTNDYANGISVDVTVRNIIGMAQYARSIGSDAVIVLLPPRSDSAAQRDQSAARRSAVSAAGASAGFVVIDPWANMVAADGGWLSGLSSDGIHPDSLTAAAGSAEAWNQLSKYVRSCWDGLQSMVGVPGGVLTSNVLFEDTNADGLPDGYIEYGGLVATRSTVAGQGGNTWTISTAGLNGGGSPVIDSHVHERSLTGLTLAANDRVALAMKVSLSGWATGMRFTARFNPTGGANAIALEPTAFAGDFSSGVAWSESVIAGATTTGVIQLTISSTGTSPVSAGSVQINQLQIWNLTQMGLA